MIGRTCQPCFVECTTIDGKSDPGKGSCFTFTLPLKHQGVLAAPSVENNFSSGKN